jgi:putative transposase
VHRQSNGSAGAITVAVMAINNGYPLSRYCAGNIMKKLDLVSSLLPKQAYKKRQKSMWPFRIYWIGNCWAYLAVVIDLFSRKPVG